MKTLWQQSTLFSILVASILIVGCASGPSVSKQGDGDTVAEAPTEYRIGPGDSLRVFVWEHGDLSLDVPVRPDGKISTPLVEDMVAEGKTPTELADDMEEVLKNYIRGPVVSVIVQEFKGQFSEQIRVVGQANNPQALSYREGITVLDVMIEVGGLTQFAAGNKAKIIRRTGDTETEIPVRLSDLMKKGVIAQNTAMRPGDVLIIPESFF